MKKNKIKLIVVLVVLGAFMTYSIVTSWLMRQKIDELKSKFLDAPILTYEKNESTRTITITSIEGEIEEYLWSDVKLYDSRPGMNLSKTTLANGTIDVGDVITDCNGLVYLWWIPTGDFLIEEIFDWE